MTSALLDAAALDLQIGVKALYLVRHKGLPAVAHMLHFIEHYN